jgi:hypothetical protein
MHEHGVFARFRYNDFKEVIPPLAIDSGRLSFSL